MAYDESVFWPAFVRAGFMVEAVVTPAGGEQEITEAEASTIKTAIARAYPSPLIVGRAAALLRGIPGKLEGVKAA